MSSGRFNWTRRCILAAGMLAGMAQAAAAKVEISFYYPIAIGGPVTKVVDDLISRFESSHPDIKVKAVYSGTYPETLSKSLAALKSGTPPDMAVVLSADMYTLVDEDAIVPIESLTKTAEDKSWLGGFSDVFMLNSRSDGKTWGIPFQRGTTVFFWNKNAFKEAGLNPEIGPQNWEEVVSFAKKLTRRDANGNVTQWGMQVPTSLTSYWILQGYVAQNGGKIADLDGRKTHFDSPEVVGALQYLVDLSRTHKVMKPGVIEWATTPKDFFEGRTAMFTTTSGNLTNVKNNAPFPFGVQILPENKRRGAPTSGGNIFIFKSSDTARQAAAFAFAKWLTSAEQAAEWSIKTGYIAPRDDAWETDAMKSYVASFPGAAVPRQQIPFMVPELSTHENQRVARAIDDGIESAVTGTRSPAEAMANAQREAERILRSYR